MIMAYRITEEEYQAINVKGKETKDKRISKKLKVLMLRYEEKVHYVIGPIFLDKIENPAYNSSCNRLHDGEQGGG